MQIMLDTRLKDLSQTFAGAFSQKNINDIGNLMHENFRLFDPVLRNLSGRDNVLRAMQKDFNKFQDIQYIAKNIYQDGNTTIIDFEIRLDDILLRGVDIMKWEQEKMVSLDCYYTEL